MLRRGSFTSPAMKVMFFQASAENREPTWATQKAHEQAESAAGREPVRIGKYG